MLLWIFLALGIGLLVLSQNRTQGELESRIDTLEAELAQMRERLITLEKLLLEKEKRRPFDEL